MTPFYRKSLLILGVSAWLAAVGLGFAGLAMHEARSGREARAGETWPSDSALPRSQGKSTLLVFLHPHCPCSQATVGELAALLADCPSEAQVCVVFYRPAGFAEGWERSSLWSQAEALRGVQLVCDADEVERERFGVFTSGQVLLYDSDGRLRYQGGLTRGRGVTGNSRGRDTLAATLLGHTTALSQAPVFGCPLVTDGE